MESTDKKLWFYHLQVISSLTLTSVGDKKTGSNKEMNWAAVTQTLKGYVKLIQFFVIWMNGWWPQKESLDFLIELKKLAEVSKKSILFKES